MNNNNKVMSFWALEGKPFWGGFNNYLFCLCSINLLYFTGKVGTGWGVLGAGAG